MDYVRSEWMTGATPQYFIHYHTNNVMHFGNTATSRVESANRLLKRDLPSSRADLLSTVGHVEISLVRQEHTVKESVEIDRVRRPASLELFMFRDIINRISRYALFKVHDIYSKHLPPGNGKAPIEECSGSTVCAGIHCVHVLSSLYETQQSLQRTHFHSH